LGDCPKFSGRSSACGRFKQQRGTEQHSRLTSYAAGKHCDSAGQYGNSTRQNGHSTGRYRDSPNIAGSDKSWSDKPWTNQPWIEFAQQHNSGKHHSTFKSQYDEQSRDFAQRLCVWNFAGSRNRSRSLRVNTDHWVVKFKSLDCW
jgi:hypothetical protein